MIIKGNSSQVTNSHVCQCHKPHQWFCEKMLLPMRTSMEKNDVGRSHTRFQLLEFVINPFITYFHSSIGNEYILIKAFQNFHSVYGQHIITHNIPSTPQVDVLDFQVLQKIKALNFDLLHQFVYHLKFMGEGVTKIWFALGFYLTLFC